MPPRSTTCLHEGHETDAEVAVALRDSARRDGEPEPEFRCINCGSMCSFIEGIAGTMRRLISSIK